MICVNDESNISFLFSSYDISINADMSSLNIDEFINVDASLYATFLLNGTPNTNLLNDSNISLLALTIFVLNYVPKFSNVSAHSISLLS